MKIELYQGLYERFSNLQITFPGDRPVAIKGLETRLVRTLNTTGGFGIFDIYLHRCLLWRRADKPLKRIASFHGPTVPSWSWMAYMGGIGYLEVPYGTVAWESTVVSPYSASADVRLNEEDASQGQIPRIEAVAFDTAILTIEDLQRFRRVILDEPGAENVTGYEGMLKCVIVGKSKKLMEDGEHAYYVLFIGTVKMKDGYTSVWERFGVGVLKGADILLEGSRTKVLIQ